LTHSVEGLILQHLPPYCAVSLKDAHGGSKTSHHRI